MRDKWIILGGSVAVAALLVISGVAIGVHLSGPEKHTLREWQDKGLVPDDSLGKEIEQVRPKVEAKFGHFPDLIK